MHKGKIAFVVGHARWGKSETLRSLTNDNYRIKYTKIGGEEFFIRRMSNDDKPRGYVKLMKSLAPKLRPYLIAALCPKFDKSSPSYATEFLQTLRANGYQLFFWVIHHQYDKTGVITAEEIQQLQKYGTVEKFDQKTDALHRSKAFKKFVKETVLQ
jgi:hypothetical protein